MLRLQKNNLVTGISKQQVEIRQLELDWYCGNYATITGQAAMLAGFCFSQLTTPMPEEPAPPFALEFGYLFLTCTAIGLELSAIILSNFLSTWAPSLALRGRSGSNDLHKAVDALRDYQMMAFGYFMTGWILFFISTILEVWIYYRRRVALVVTVPLSCFIVAALWYMFDITVKLRLQDHQVVAGKIDHFHAYEHIADLDYNLSAAGERGAPSDSEDGREGHCPLHETFVPRKASERAQHQIEMATRSTARTFSVEAQQVGGRILPRGP